MATVTFDPVKTLCNEPFLVKKATFTGGTTAAAVTHGQDVAPDVYFIVANDSTNPTQTGFGVNATSDGSTASSTALFVDCIVDAAEAATLYMIWFRDPGTGGLNPP